LPEDTKEQITNCYIKDLSGIKEIDVTQVVY